MLQTMNLPLDRWTLGEYAGPEALRKEISELGIDGVEAIGAWEDLPEDFPRDLVQGYHLIFYPDWVDLWQENWEAVERKFGSLRAAEAFYGGLGRRWLLDQYRADLQRALALRPRYLVYHVSDVSIEEGYTYRWLHSDEAVMDAAAELANALLGDRDPGCEFLMENQWWPGLTLTDRAKARYLLDAVRCPAKGFLLDTGHMMNSNPDLRTQEEGADYLLRMVEGLGDLADCIHGIHLHYSLSGPYVKAHTGLCPDLPRDYGERFRSSYSHILQIDWHRPWSDPAVRRVVDAIQPRYLTHELSGRDRKTRAADLRTQLDALWGVRK